MSTACSKLHKYTRCVQTVHRDHSPTRLDYQSRLTAFVASHLSPFLCFTPRAEANEADVT